ncbi:MULTISPECIES: FecR family protein [Butyricimonas]|uniref:FecR family protein n=1 Tax=Butyricimonas TaxID=574697 RepID=UPI0007FB247F|nr:MULTISPECIES: FecR family protein [Butyricimonas]
MKVNEKNDQLEFVLNVLNHPELLQDEYVREWLSHAENKKLYEECRLYLEAGLKLEVGDSVDVRSEFEKFKRRMTSPTRVLYRWTAAVAVVVILVASGWWLMNEMPSRESGREVIVGMRSAVVPGKNQAVLVTETGREIVLGMSSGMRVMEEGGVDVTDDSTRGVRYSGTEVGEVRYHTLRVPKGGEYRIVLSDGTEVWLNSESELRYPTVFTGERRVVELKGEGYFSVTRDERQPFIVVASGVRTKVYGTEFNVKAYADNKVDVTLVEGKVAVKRASDDSEYALTPGQNAHLEAGAVPLIEKVNVHKYIAWKEGYFYYENERLEVIVNDLKRWYDFDVVYVGSGVKDLRFELWSGRDSDIGVIMGLLTKTNRVSVRLDGRTLIVSERGK